MQGFVAIRLLLLHLKSLGKCRHERTVTVYRVNEYSVVLAANAVNLVLVSFLPKIRPWSYFRNTFTLRDVLLSKITPGVIYGKYR